MSLLVNVAFEPLAILAIAIASLMSLFTAFASRRRASGRKAVTTGIPVYLDTGYPADDASIALDVPNSHSVHDFQCAKGFLLTLRDLKLHEDKQTGYNLPSVRTTGKQYCSKIDVTISEADDNHAAAQLGQWNMDTTAQDLGGGVRLPVFGVRTRFAKEITEAYRKASTGKWLRVLCKVQLFSESVDKSSLDRAIKSCLPNVVPAEHGNTYISEVCYGERLEFTITRTTFHERQQGDVGIQHGTEAEAAGYGLKEQVGVGKHDEKFWGQKLGNIELGQTCDVRMALPKGPVTVDTLSQAVAEWAYEVMRVHNESPVKQKKVLRPLTIYVKPYPDRKVMLLSPQAAADLSAVHKLAQLSEVKTEKVALFQRVMSVLSGATPQDKLTSTDWSRIKQWGECYRRCNAPTGMDTEVYTDAVPGVWQDPAYFINNLERPITIRITPTLWFDAFGGRLYLQPGQKGICEVHRVPYKVTVMLQDDNGGATPHVLTNGTYLHNNSYKVSKQMNALALAPGPQWTYKPSTDKRLLLR